MYHLAFFVCCQTSGDAFPARLSKFQDVISLFVFIGSHPLLSSLVKNSIIELTTDYSFCFLAAMPDALPAADS